MRCGWHSTVHCVSMLVAQHGVLLLLVVCVWGGLCVVCSTALCTVRLCWWHSMACCCWCVCVWGGGCVLFVAQHSALCVQVPQMQAFMNCGACVRHAK